jgi:hypothetical protein
MKLHIIIDTKNNKNMNKILLFFINKEKFLNRFLLLEIVTIKTTKVTIKK